MRTLNSVKKCAHKSLIYSKLLPSRQWRFLLVQTVHSGLTDSEITVPQLAREFDLRKDVQPYKTEYPA
jgi:hypothetical protein